LEVGDSIILEVDVTEAVFAQFGGELVPLTYSTASMVYHMKWISRDLALPYLEDAKENAGIAKVSHFLVNIALKNKLTFWKMNNTFIQFLKSKFCYIYYEENGIMKNKIVIIGLGLIGGSIALALKQHGYFKIVGVDKHNDTVEKALEKGIVSECFNSIEDAVIDADLIIIATPVSTTIEVLNKLHEIPFKEKVLVTDVGSTKEVIVQHSLNIKKDNIIFIGGHPMTGSHKSGIEEARGDLMRESIYILTPHKDIHQNEVNLLKKLLACTEAKFVTMNPTTHDKLAGSISHFPHIIASALVHQVEDLAESHPILKDLAAGGFRKITRNASANPIMWRDISLQNKKTLLKMIDEWQERMRVVSKLIEDEDNEGLFNFFKYAKTYRDSIGR